MGRRILSLFQDFHLLAGLFAAPFLLVYAVSALLLNHPGIPLGEAAWSAEKTVPVELPTGMEEMDAGARLKPAQDLLRQSGIWGEISYIGASRKERKWLIPVTRPGYEARLEVSLADRTLSVRERRTGFWDKLLYLHKMPGPHLADLRGNWLGMRIWKILADTTVWLTLLLAVSGIWLWASVRSERRPGLVLILAGMIILGGAVYAVCR